MEKKTINQQDLGIKRMPDTITVDIPIEAVLEIEVTDKKVYAHLTLQNTSEKDVYIDKNKIGGRSVKEEIFFLTPYDRGANLTFISGNSFFTAASENYSVIKPGEVVKTSTDLTKYYNFQEKEYEILSIIYSCPMKLIGRDLVQVKQPDRTGIIRPVKFYIVTNRVVLNYNDDILLKKQ